ncbi:dTMP kinase [Brevundimonas balnearis]|uniref:Thymidylate kinase n=1 Tax=Brevundimonas balnearis TaxID=1572858 RepID=A0ABV6QZ58_9CAUL
MTRGRFITLEGGEGAGKSTQAARLVEALERQGRRVIRTREPGGSKGAEDIRGLVVRGDAERWSARTEALLMFAARSDHLERTIRPALERGEWVICDRFADSSRVYQGVAGGLDPDFIEALDEAVVGPDQPDLTLIFDLPVETGLARAGTRAGDEDRFEGKGAAFHARLAEGFRDLPRRFPGRCVLIDASGDPDAVSARVMAAVEARLG